MWNDTNFLHWRDVGDTSVAGSRSRTRASALAPFSLMALLIGQLAEPSLQQKLDGVKGTQKSEAERSLAWPFL